MHYCKKYYFLKNRTDVFEKIEHVTYPDEGDKFEREPEIAVFTLKGCGKFLISEYFTTLW